jgi:zinc protease
VNLVDWHTTWFRPNNATLVVVGDTTIEQIKPRIEALFENWTPAAVPEKNISMIAVQPNDIVYLIDKPQAEQSMIFAGQLITPLDNPDEVAIQAMNDVLGGQFSSRVNINLRETKHWSYGARSLIMSTKAQRPFIMYAPVQTDKTGPSLSEMHREITELRSSNPPKAEELQRIQRSRTLSLPGRWETNGAVAGAVAEIVVYDLPHDHWDGYANRINSLELEQLKQAAIDTLDPAKIVWVIVGDREKIEAQIRATHLGTIKLIDTDGNPVNSSDE